jgi:hypothetical protein
MNHETHDNGRRRTMRHLLNIFLRWLHPPRFAKYRPAARVGTRRVETRLLRRLAWRSAETVQ